MTVLNRVFAAIILTLLMVAPLHAENGATKADSNIVLVLDGSGSMWGRLDGEPKIDVARTVVYDLLENWPANTQLGLMAYGHRREKDCEDIETLIPLGPFDQAATASAVKDVTPRGRTPLTEAVRRAAADLAASQGKGAVILVTDGLETCGGDPCALGRELAANGLDLTAHVVGFDLAAEDTGALQCLAEQTGGNYYPADDAGALRDALGDATQAAVSERNVILRALGADGGLLPEDTPLLWEIYAVQPDGSTGERVALARNVETALSLPPGQYRIVAAQGEDAVQEADLAVPDGEEVLKEITFTNGEVRLTAHLAPGLPALSMPPFTWIITREKTDGSMTQVAREAGADVAFILPAGNYRGEVRSEDLRVGFDMPVEGGGVRSQEVVLNAGYLRASGPQGVSWTLYRIDETGAETRAASEARATTTFLVEAGRYLAEARLGRDERRRYEAEVLAGEETSVEADFEQ